MSDSVVVRSKIKELISGYNITGDFADALDEKVKRLSRFNVNTFFNYLR